MNVRCVRCGSPFDFEDALVSEAGVAVRCSSCGHIFRLRRRKAGADEPSAALRPGASPERDWQVRTANGAIQVFPELHLLKSALEAGRIAPDDEVSLSGERWVRLGDLEALSQEGAFGRSGTLLPPVGPVSAEPPTPVLPTPPTVMATGAALRRLQNGEGMGEGEDRKEGGKRGALLPLGLVLGFVVLLLGLLGAYGLWRRFP